MDFVKKHYFWIVCGVLTAVALGAWVWTYMDMNARRAADQAKIDAALQTLNQVRGIPDHPNSITHTHMEERIDALKVSVKQAWQDQYTQQVNLFVWPERFPRNMRNTLSRFRPIEAHFSVFPTPPANEVDVQWRVAYADYMRDELPKLAEIIGAEWRVNTDGATTGSGSEGYTPYSSAGGYPSSGGYPGSIDGTGTPGAMEEERPVVEWNPGNQQEIYNLRFNWAASPNQVPTTLQMLYAQEDFWTLQSMMEIIRRTNGDADAYYEALVKEIQFIRIGAAAVPSDARIIPYLGAGVGAGTGTGTGTEGMPVEGSGSGDPYGMPQPGMPVEGMPGGALDGAGNYGSGTGMVSPLAIDPATGRYVDNAYKPLSAEELRASLTTTDPAKAYLAVAKRMPVRMRVRMDQRYLSRLLIECANAPLTVEVRQVRINPGTSGDAGSAYGGMAYGGSGGSSAYSAPSSGGFGGGGGGLDSASYPSSSSAGYGTGSGQPGPGSSFDAVVEIYGIVYIYNPPVEGPLDVEAPAGSEGEGAAPEGETLTAN